MKQLENKLNAASTLENATNILLKWYEGSDIVFFRTFVEKLPDFVLNTFLNAGYITDANSDNVIYGRKNGEWVDTTGTGMDVDVYDPSGIKEQLLGQSAVQEITNKTIIDLSNNIFANRIHSKAIAYSTDIEKLQPVRIIGYDSGTSTNIGEIVNNSIYTAYGLAGESTTVGEPFEVVHQGLIENVDTSIFNEGNILYVSSVGDLTSVKPTEGIIQPIAYVVRVDSVYGALLVNGFYTVPTALQIPFDNTILGVDVFTVQEAVDYLAQNGGGSGGISDGDKGDITVTGSGSTWTIDNGAVTLAKQADMATASVVYRKTAGVGAPEVQTLATLKTDLGLSNTNSGDNAVNSLYSGLTQYTDELAQDAVGAMLQSTATKVQLTYTDVTPELKAEIVAGSIDETDLDASINASLDLADSAVQAASTTTFTNKTFDANGTGNSISNIEVADLAAGVLDTDLSTVAGTDTTIPSAKATKAALDLKQNTLVSATNIKTVNGVSILGAGDLPVSATPAGATTQVQFNNAGAFGADSLFAWDTTNKRLGVGIAPTVDFEVRSAQKTGSTNYFAKIASPATTDGYAATLFSFGQYYHEARFQVNVAALSSGSNFGKLSVSNSQFLQFDAGTFEFYLLSAGASRFFMIKDSASNIFFKADNDSKSVFIGGGASAPTARLHVKGLGATSGTSSFRVEDSAGAQMFNMNDAGHITFGKNSQTVNLYNNAGNTGFSLENTGVSNSGIRFSVNNAINEFSFKHGANFSFSLGKYGAAGTEGRAWFGWAASLVTVDLSAQVQIDSTTRGFLIPRMTGAQVEAIASPAEGLMAYATNAGVGAITAKGWWGYNGTTWEKLNP